MARSFNPNYLDALKNNKTITAQKMLIRQWIIGLLFVAIGFGQMAIYEYRLSQIEQNYQEEMRYETITRSK